MKSVLAIATLLATTAVYADVAATVDFSDEKGAVNPWLHCSGLGPKFTRFGKAHDAYLKDLHLTAARTHDWALVNPGQRLCDTHFIFPLMHLDAKDPKNYFFGPTDEIIRRTQALGMKVLFRLGTSIEHMGEESFFNAAIPEDFEQYAEVMAGIVRHYSKGWAGGFENAVCRWEIWNEPNGYVNMWRMREPDDERHTIARGRFVKFFSTVLKRLKAEFPDQVVGGPALGNTGWTDEKVEFVTELAEGCKAVGVRPDFISWHHYGRNPDEILSEPALMRGLCDKLGLSGVELILDEWHYTPYSGQWNDYGGAPARRKLVYEGPTSQNGIDSAVYTLQVLSGFQSTPLDQSYFYGCGEDNWGCIRRDGTYNKNYYALKIFGRFVADCDRFVACNGASRNIRLFAAKGRAGKDDLLLVTDYLGGNRLIDVEVKGLPKEAQVVEALVLSDGIDLLPVDVSFRDGKLRLVKPDVNSAAFLVAFR